MNDKVQLIYEALQRQFNSQLINTKELAQIMGVHPETINRQRRELRGVPSQQNVGKGAKTQYALLDIAEYIVNNKD